MKYTTQTVKNVIAARHQTYFVGDKQHLLPYAVNLVSLPDRVALASLEAIAHLADAVDNMGCMMAAEIFLATMHKIYTEARKASAINKRPG